VQSYTPSVNCRAYHNIYDGWLLANKLWHRSFFCLLLFLLRVPGTWYSEKASFHRSIRNERHSNQNKAFIMALSHSSMEAVFRGGVKGLQVGL